MNENNIPVLIANEGLSKFNAIEFFRLFLNKKLFIFISTSVITIIAIIISLLLPESYKSTSIILPETDKSKVTVLGGFSDLASMAGIGGGDASPIRLYPTILKSTTVLKSVICNKYKTKKYPDSVNLIQYWAIKKNSTEAEIETALTLLRTGLDVSMETKSSIITLTMETGEPQLTADIINNVTSELDKYMRTKRTTNASRQRMWIEARLGEVKQELAISENQIKEFREKNRSVSSSPLLLLEQDRLLREIQINATLYTELKKQFELIKIEEIKNLPIVNVMDVATPAVIKSKPRRSIIVIAWFFIALMGSMSYLYVKHYYSRKIRDVVLQVLNLSPVISK